MPPARALLAVRELIHHVRKARPIHPFSLLALAAIPVECASPYLQLAYLFCIGEDFQAQRRSRLDQLEIGELGLDHVPPWVLARIAPARPDPAHSHAGCLSSRIWDVGSMANGIKSRALPALWSMPGSSRRSFRHPTIPACLESAKAARRMAHNSENSPGGSAAGACASRSSLPAPRRRR